MPTFSTFDPAYSAFPNAVISGNQALKPRVCADGSHLFQRQLCGGAAFSAIGSAVQNAVCLIGSGSVPPKVRNVIVPRVAVIMAALHALGSWANKSLQNKRVWPYNFNLVVSPQSKKRAGVRYVAGNRLDFTGFHGANATMIRNLVKTFKTYDGKPIFHVPTMGMFVEKGNL